MSSPAGGMTAMARVRAGRGTWRWLAVASCATIAMTLSSCGSNPAAVTTPRATTAATIEATPEAIPTTTAAQKETAFLDEGGINMVGTDGYTATIVYKLAVADFQESVVNDAPGFASITFATDATAGVENTTSGRANPSTYTWSALALYPITSMACKVTKELMRDSITPVMPGFGQSEDESESFCALSLSENLGYGATVVTNDAPLEPSQIAAMQSIKGIGTSVEVISKVPEGSVSQLITELQAPAKIVYQVTAGKFNNDPPEQQSAEGEYCNAYLHNNPQWPSTALRSVGIFVPTKYSPLCKGH